MIPINETKDSKNILQEAFLNFILQKIGIGSDICKALFMLRYNPKNKSKKLSQLAKIIIDDYGIIFQEDGINECASRVSKKILTVFKDEMQEDRIDVDSRLNNSRTGRPLDNNNPFQVTYKWLWENKFPRMGWELAKEFAASASEQLNMIDIEKSVKLEIERSFRRGLNFDVIPEDYGNSIKLMEQYRLLIDLSIKDKYLLLIDHSVDQENKRESYLLSPSKAFTDVPYTLLSEDLYLPPDDGKRGRASCLQYDAVGEEYFLAIVTEQPIELSWVHEECQARDIILNEERLNEIFVKVGQQSNSEAYYKRFQVVK